MGLKGSGPFFQRSMSNKVLVGYVTRMCDIYIDDVLLAKYWEGSAKTRSQPIQQRQDSVSMRLNMWDTWYQAREPHSPKRSVFKSSSSHCQKLRRHFFSSLDWRTTSATMSRIWRRWFNPFESWWAWRSARDPRNWHGQMKLYTGKLIIGIYRKLSEVFLINSDNFIGSDKFIGWLFSV